MGEDRIGVVLCNIGGPPRADERVVRAYLARFFSDPAILPVRQPLRWMIARKIARRRAPESARNYAAIGGGSPILAWTEAQARLLEERLAARGDGRRYRVAVAMRYARPFTEEAIDRLDREGFRRIVSLPLYPQESCASTGSALSEVDRVIAERNGDRGANFLAKAGEVRHFHDHPTYVRALVERIEEGLAGFPGGERPHLLFSAHGLPQSYIDGGDPYQKHVESTVRAAVAGLAPGLRHSLAYQSRVGPQKWLEPDTAVEIQRLGREGTRAILAIPVAFVSDHVETLHEIGIQYAALARRSGVDRFACTRGLNDSPTFARALEEIVVAALAGAGARAASAA